METTVTGKNNGLEWEYKHSPLTQVERGGFNARTRVALRISNEGHKLGFKETVLGGGWVTAEVSLELPHANTASAQQQAQTTGFTLARQGLEQGLEMLLASMTESEENVRLLQAFLDNPGAALSQGIAEPMVRALRAAPRAVWSSLTAEEQEELAGCYRKLV